MGLVPYPRKMARSSVQYDRRVQQKKHKILKTCAIDNVESAEKQQFVVEEVVKDIVDYVIRKEELDDLITPYDLDDTRTLHITNGLCSKEYCYKGCVCGSLDNVIVRKHCGKEDCIFHCICDKRYSYSLRNLPHRERIKTMLSNKSPKRTKENEMAAIEKELPNGTKKKRQCSNVDRPIAEIPSIDLCDEDEGESIPVIEIEDEEDDVEAISVAKVNRPYVIREKLTSLSARDRRKLAKLKFNNKNFIALADVFVWCPVHKRYSCACRGRVFDLRTNLLLWKPTGSGSLKDVAKYFLFDSERHTARTFGSMFDYRLRNSSFMFNVKRNVEINNNVLCNSNGFIKIDIPPAEVMIAKVVKPVKTGVTASSSKQRPERKTIIVKKLAIPKNTPTGGIVEEIDLNLTDPLADTEKDKHLPDFGLLCSNKAFGYLPVKEYSPTTLVFQNPIFNTVFVCNKDIAEANDWLDNFFRTNMVFESPEVRLEWTVVKQSVLKKSTPFKKSLMNDKTIVIDNKGISRKADRNIRTDENES